MIKQIGFNCIGLFCFSDLFEPFLWKGLVLLVVVMHGYTSSAENIMSYSKMNEVAVEGFAI